MRSIKKTAFSCLSLIIVFLFLFHLQSSAAIRISCLHVVEQNEKLLYNGVTASYIAVEDAVYGRQKFNIVEFNPKQKDLYLRVGLSGSKLTNNRKVLDTAQAYNKTNESVLAAVNGDLWMTSVHTGPVGTTRAMPIPRGFIMSGGVILCSAQTFQEVPEDPNYWSVGFTNEYNIIIGMPKVSLKVTNISQNTVTRADGLNRLPADNSLMIYNSVCSDKTYAPSTAYEVVLNNVKGEFRHGSTITGTVSAITAGGTTSLTPGRLILMARGSKKSLIAKYKTGDAVKIDVKITESTMGNSKEWQKVTEAVGAHMPMILNGNKQTGQSIKIPSTVVAVRKDGSAFFMVNDGRQPEWSAGLLLEKMPEMLEEMGAYHAVHLDGGGSSTMVWQTNGGLSVINRPSDLFNTPRRVANSLLLIKGAPHPTVTPVPITASPGPSITASASSTKTTDTASISPSPVTTPVSTAKVTVPPDTTVPSVSGSGLQNSDLASTAIIAQTAGNLPNKGGSYKLVGVGMIAVSGVTAVGMIGYAFKRKKRKL